MPVSVLNGISINLKSRHMKKTLLAGLFMLCATQLFAQSFEVPKGYKLVAKEDYAPYENDVIKGVEWLMDTPLSEERSKREEVNAFLMKWISGSPNVSVVLSEDIVTFMDTPDCLMVFLGGWVKYSIESKNYKDNVKGNLAGLEHVIAFYLKNRETLGKNKAIERYVKLKEKNKLEEFIQSKV